MSAVENKLIAVFIIEKFGLGILSLLYVLLQLPFQTVEMLSNFSTQSHACSCANVQGIFYPNTEIFPTTRIPGFALLHSEPCLSFAQLQYIAIPPTAHRQGLFDFLPDVQRNHHCLK